MINNLNHPKISIILPTYNGEKWISESIESIINQSENDWELIIVNDNSTDRTIKIIEEFSEKDRRIKIISNKSNDKLPAALNKGFREAKGKFLTWTSDDNIYKVDALKVMSLYLEQNEEIDLVSFNMELIGENGEILQENWASKFKNRSPMDLSHVCNIGAAFMYTRKIFNIIGYYSEDKFCAEDYDYWVRMCLVSNIAYIDDIIIYKYRVNSKSLTATRSNIVKHMTKKIQSENLLKFINKFNFDYFRTAKIIFSIKIIPTNFSLIKYIPAIFLITTWRTSVQILGMILFPSNKIKRREFKLKLNIWTNP